MVGCRLRLRRPSSSTLLLDDPSHLDEGMNRFSRKTTSSTPAGKELGGQGPSARRRRTDPVAGPSTVKAHNKSRPSIRPCTFGGARVDFDFAAEWPAAMTAIRQNAQNDEAKKKQEAADERRLAQPV